MKKSIYKIAVLGAVILGGLAPSDHAYNGPLPTPMEILADTNRNGIVDINDAIAKHTWTSQSGSIYTVNFDADGGLYHPNPSSPSPANKRSDAVTFGDDGKVDFEDYFINTPAASGGPADVDDIATVKIKAIGLEPQFRVYLKVATEVEMRAIHIFRKRVAGTNTLTDAAIWGGGHNPTAFPTPWTDGDSEVKDIEVTRWLNPNTNTTTYEETRSPVNSPYYEFGIEGLLLAGMKYYPPVGAEQTFSGYIYLTVEVRDGSGTPISGMSDTICMRVAPWIGLSAGEPSEEIWATQVIPNAPEWTALSDPFRNAPFASPYTGLANSADANQLRLVTQSLDAGTQWLEDHVEWGFTQRPGGPKVHLAFRMPYIYPGSRQPKWPISRLLGPNLGVFQIGELGSTNPLHYSHNYGGNLGFLPRSTIIPNGRLLMGGSASQPLQDFLYSQEYQYSAGHSFWLDVNWLFVGHIDEVMAFLPGNRVVLADSRLAITELEKIPAPQRAGHVFFSTNSQTLTGTLTNDTDVSNPYRIHTGVNLTGTAFQYIRILEGPAAGYVAKIQGGNGFVDVIDETPVSPPGAPTYKALWRSFDVGAPAGNKLESFRTRLQGGSSPISMTTASYPKTGNKYVLVVDSNRVRPTVANQTTYQGMPAVISVEEILADTVFTTLNRTSIPAKVAVHEVIVRDAFGIGANVQVIYVPALYFGRLETNGTPSPNSVTAFQPNPCNFQPLGISPQAAGNRLYFPRQFAPKAAGQNIDMFEALIASRFSETVRFVDDWAGYHLSIGNVHCGTSVKRAVPTNDWWQ